MRTSRRDGPRTRHKRFVRSAGGSNCTGGLAPEFDGPEDTLSDFERFIDGLATYPETGVSLGQLSTRRTGPGARV